MGPQIAEHRGVKIRYGYDIASDKFIAHITVPQRLRDGGVMQTRVRGEFRRALPGSKYSGSADSVEALLDTMRHEIDHFLDG